MLNIVKDAESIHPRFYHVYLFERILLIFRTVAPAKGKLRKPGDDQSDQGIFNLYLKGEIFLRNIIRNEVTSRIE